VLREPSALNSGSLASRAMFFTASFTALFTAVLTVSPTLALTWPMASFNWPTFTASDVSTPAATL
jgi:hypothetical protein